MSQALKQQVLHSLKWVALGKILTQLIRWIMTFWVIRLLVPEDYGFIAMADVLFGFLLLLIGSLFTPAIIQAKELSQQMLKQLFGMILLVHSSIFLLQMFLADSIGAFYQSEQVASILKVNAWCFLILAFQVIPSAILARNMDFKRVSIITAIANITAAITTFVMALMGYGFWAIIIGEIVAISLNTLMVLVIQPITFLPEFKVSRVTQYLKFGSLLTLHTIIFYVFLHMDVTIAGRVLTATEIGLFAIGLQFALMPQKKILPLLKQVAFPAFSKIQDQPERINAYIMKAQKLSFLLTVPVFWGLAAVVDQIIPIIIGDKWSGAIIPTMIILFIMPLRFSEELFNPALKSQQKARHMVINVSIMATILLISILFFVQYGAVGLALAWLFSFPISYLIVAYRNCRAFSLPLTLLFRSLVAPLLAGTFMVGTIFAAKLWLVDISLTHLIAQIVIGGVTFAMVIWLLDKNGIKELIKLLRNKKA